MSTTSIELQEALATRFLRYSAISSQSDASATVVPSSQGQWEFAQLLAMELEEAGVENLHLSDTCVLTARIPSTLADGTKAPTIGFCTHLDTADSGLNPDVHARIIEHTGGDIHLGGDQWIRREEHPEIDAYVGQRILVTDGTSVLGADDKAGVASVMEAVVTLMADSRPHPEVYLSFVPDEEIGLRGVRTMDLERFPVDWAYTLDCCELGEVVEATFNAAYATVVIEGVAAHPMSAFGVLVNPILVAHDLIGRFDPAQTPECTKDREGYIWVDAIHGDQSATTVDLNIRDHDRARFEERKDEIRNVVEQVRAAHPRARIDVTFEDIYANLEDSKTPDNAIAAQRLLEAMSTVGVEPLHRSMRGGTDGSWLSTQGIFTPNFFTGAHNFHSRCEFLPLPSLERSHQVVMELMRGASC